MPRRDGAAQVAIVSDTHLPRGNRRLPDACWQHLAKADLIVHAGDFVVRGVLDDLEALGPPVAAVHGNMDSADLVADLPERRLIDVEGAQIGIVHDAGPANGRLRRLRRLFPDADAVIFGHSHIPLHEEDAGFQIFNPGSPTDRRRQPRHTMGLARIRGGEIEFEVLFLH
jgi:putative phosphoesterase